MYGTLTDLHKKMDFPFQNLYRTNVLLMDDPNIDIGAYGEALKNILGGNQFMPNLKYRGATMIIPPPVFILTNKTNLFDMSKTEWSSRIKDYKTNVYPHFKEINRSFKLHPLGYLKLFEQVLKDKF